jgi:uncharacterized protein YjbJ (UPF0337 family)
VKEIKGAVKEVAGKAAGDTKLDSDGKADKVQARFKTPQAASKTHSKGNRLNARVLYSMRSLRSKAPSVQPDADSFDEVVVNRLSSVQSSEPDTIARI